MGQCELEDALLRLNSPQSQYMQVLVAQLLIDRPPTAER